MAWLSAFLTLLTSVNTLQRKPSSMFNANSALKIINLPVNITDVPLTTNGCFYPRTSETFLLPVIGQDCYQAIDKLLELFMEPRGKVLTFGNQYGDDIRLPKSIKYETCRIDLEVGHGSDDDEFDLWTLYGVGLALAESCTEGPVFQYGGIRTVGRKGVISLRMTGRLPPPMLSTATPSATETSNMLNSTQSDATLGGKNITASFAIVATILASLDSPTTSGCFDPPTTWTPPMLPVVKSDCYEAADRLLDEVLRQPRDIDLKFGRRNQHVDIQLPIDFSVQTCGIYIDVVHIFNTDSFELWTLYGATLDLISRCTTGSNRYGGVRTVGPKRVVQVFIGGRDPRPTAGFLKSTASSNVSVVARAQTENGPLGLPGPSSPNVSSLKLVPIVNSASDNKNGDCFDPPTPRAALYPTNFGDCSNAARGLMQDIDPFKSFTFARKGKVGYRLPKVVRNGTCVISLDVTNDDDRDCFKPLNAYIATVDIISRCTRRKYNLGGRTLVGPGNVLNVVVFGRIWPSVNGTIASNTALLVERAQPSGSPTALLYTPQSSLATSATGKTTGYAQQLGFNGTSLTSPTLRGIPECFDPPLPRERSWPIDFEDCEQATFAIIGGRDRYQEYTFSRKPLTTDFYYPLPTTLRYRTCVILVDMISDQDEDTVRLGYVESTAWVLAHKCSGYETPREEYGGRMTVGMNSKNLINIWVYGRLWPPPIRSSNSSNVLLLDGR